MPAMQRFSLQGLNVEMQFCTIMAPHGLLKPTLQNIHEECSRLRCMGREAEKLREQTESFVKLKGI